MSNVLVCGLLITRSLDENTARRIELLKKVQHRFTRMIEGFSLVPYEERLEVRIVDA